MKPIIRTYSTREELLDDFEMFKVEGLAYVKKEESFYVFEQDRIRVSKNLDGDLIGVWLNRQMNRRKDEK